MRRFCHVDLQINSAFRIDSNQLIAINELKRQFPPLLEEISCCHFVDWTRMWPFTRRKIGDNSSHAPCEATVVARKLRSNCRNVESSLNACLKANSTHPERCEGIKWQLRHCQANVLCPDLAKLYDHCQIMEVNRAVRLHDSVNQHACAKVMDEMTRCLASRANRKHLEAASSSSNRERQR